jgi:hypothetical protein
MRRLLPILGVLAALAAPRPAAALFHIAVINEVMTSYDGDPNVQFVEIKMLMGGQTITTNSVLAAFNAAGVYQGDILVVGADLPNGGANKTWLMGTTAFETASGIQVDFEFTPGLITQSGMICWGAPGIAPPDPPDWDRNVFTNYVDCIAYGEFTGASNVHTGDPTPLSPDGHSLKRVTETDDNAADFACGDPADPTNLAGTAGSLAATTACPVVAAPFTKGQAKCIDKLHGGANGVAKAASGAVKSCASAFAKGKSTSTLDCLMTDLPAKLTKPKAKTVAAETKFCAGENLPPFGSLGATAWNDAGDQAATRAFFDLFDPDTGTADDVLVTKAANADGAKCQGTAIAQVARAVDGVLKASQRAQKAIYAPKAGGAPPESALEAATALDAALAADPKLAKLALQVEGEVAKRCQDTAAIATLFGFDCGDAASPTELGACVYDAGACEACLELEEATGLDLDCEALANAECQPPA